MPRNEGFIARNEIVGWITNQHGNSRAINAVVVGREKRETTITEKGAHVKVQTYVIPTGNEFLLTNLTNSVINPNGWRDHEFVITEYLSEEFASTLYFSPPCEIQSIESLEDKIIRLEPNKPLPLSA